MPSGPLFGGVKGFTAESDAVDVESAKSRLAINVVAKKEQSD